MSGEALYSTERADKILAVLREQGSASVNYLAGYFNVSGATIRTDLTKLESAGEVIRTHGGAMLKSSLQRELRICDRINEDKKELIADKALELIQNEDTILLDTGTTMQFLAQSLLRSSISRLRIYSIDLEVLRILEARDDYELYLLGGRIRNGFHYCYGTQIVDALEKYNFEKLFLASSAISFEHGLTVTNSELSRIKQTMIKSSKSICLLADSTKLGRIDFESFARLDEIDTLIMDNSISDADKKRLKEEIGKVILV